MDNPHPVTSLCEGVSQCAGVCIPSGTDGVEGVPKMSCLHPFLGVQGNLERHLLFLLPELGTH